MLKLSSLKIDPEFSAQILPLSFEELQQLEQNIIAEGRLLNPIITWNGYILDGQNTVEARRTCNGGMELPIRCKVFYGLTKEAEATLFAIQTGNATCLTAGERLRANLVAENPDALYFVGITSNAGVEFAYDGIRAPWKIYCIETAYELYKQYGCERYVEMLHIINEAWKGNVDSNPAFEEPSMILLEQIFTIDKSRIERFMGYASKAEMLRIDMALLVSLALNVLSGSRSE